jgi:4-amino-4-deoxy-L-arabinose transferase-like glycosyltransferase
MTLRPAHTTLLMAGVMVLATLWRVWNIDQTAILFSDAGRDLLVAADSVKQGTLPLLGIPSSVPRFHQGPVTIWLEMAGFLVWGSWHLGYSLLFALISIAAVLFAFWWLEKAEGTFAGVVSAVLLAASPLAIAHGRMVYHITPLPLTTLMYLASLWWVATSVTEGKGASWRWVVATAAGWLMFQFELATTPLLLLLLYVRGKQALQGTKVWQWWWLRSVLLGTVVGLWPQLLYDVTHRFSHLGGFVVWLVYRSVSALWLPSQHGLGPSKFVTAFQYLWVYFQRFFGFDQVLVSVLFLGLVLVAVAWQLKVWRRERTTAGELITIGWLLLVGGYIVHGTPSEAYFPPLLALAIVLLASSVTALPSMAKKWVALLCFTLLLNTALYLPKAHWWVDTTSPWQYGQSIGVQREMMTTIYQHAGQQFTLDTTAPGKMFPSYFDNLKWVGLTLDHSISDGGERVFIENLDSELLSYPGAKSMIFSTQAVVLLPSY